MNLKLLAIPLFAVVAVLAVACKGGDTVVQTSNQNLSGVSATGTGRAVGEPDVAILTVGVNVERATVEEAREVAAGAQQSVIDSLRANGVAEDDIQTVQFSVYPRYDYRPDQTPRIIGYTVNNVVTAKIRNLDVTGKAIDDATRAGGNDAVIQGISFSVDDPTELRREARQQAVERAREQAEQLANAAGYQLGKLISISESGPSYDPIIFARGGAAEADAAQTISPVQPGEVEVAVSVNLLYELED